jgi:hypothetical protein
MRACRGIDELAIEHLTCAIALGHEHGRLRSGDDPGASAFIIHHAIEMAVIQLLVPGIKAADADTVLCSLRKMICRDLLEDDLI